MGAIQSAVNSMIGSLSHAVVGVTAIKKLSQKQAAGGAKTEKAGSNVSPQKKAAAQAANSAANAIEAKKVQKRNFMDYLAKQKTSLGGTVGELPASMQKQIASQYSKSQRKRLMDAMDREARNGK